MPITRIPPLLKRNGPSLQTAGLLPQTITSLLRLTYSRRRSRHKSRLSTSISFTILPSQTARAIGHCQPTTWTPKPLHHGYGAPGRASFVSRTQFHYRITPPTALILATAITKAKAQAIPTYPVALLWYPRMPKEDSKRYRGSYAFAEESFLPGGASSS